MKIFLSTILFFFLFSCTSSVKDEKPEYVPVNLPKEKVPTQAGYYCPMKCEGEKVYENKRLPCPVCDMKLVPTKAN